MVIDKDKTSDETSGNLVHSEPRVVNVGVAKFWMPVTVTKRFKIVSLCVYFITSPMRIVFTKSLLVCGQLVVSIYCYLLDMCSLCSHRERRSQGLLSSRHWLGVGWPEFRSQTRARVFVFIMFRLVLDPPSNIQWVSWDLPAGGTAVEVWSWPFSI